MAGPACYRQNLARDRAKSPFYAISRNGIADLFCRRKARANNTGMFDFWVTGLQHQPWHSASLPLGDPQELGSVTQPINFQTGIWRILQETKASLPEGQGELGRVALGRQLFAAFCASPRNDAAAAFRRHTRAKTMPSLTHKSTWLESAFH
jgi:hypothetical protein